MRNLFFILVGLFIFNIGMSQNSFFTRKYNNKNLQKILQKMSVFNENSNFILDYEAKICSEYWSTNYENELTYLGEGEIIFEKIDGKFIAKSTEFNLKEDGSIDTMKFTYYFHSTPDYDAEFVVDSAIVTTNFNGEQIVAVKWINEIDNDLIHKSELSLNFDYFMEIPYGLKLFEYSNFYYEDNNNLKAISNYAFDIFETFEIVLNDSTDFKLNATGMPEEAEYFVMDNGEIHIYTLNKYFYNSDNLLEKVEYYNNPEDWKISEREVYTYSADAKTYLYERTFDKGASWFQLALDSTYLSSDLPYNYPEKVVSYFYENEWKVNEMTTYKQCTGPSNVNENNYIELYASLIDNYLQIISNEDLNNSRIMLYNINGRTVFNRQFNIVPDNINVGNLSQGIYILDLRKDDKNNCQKLVKF